MPVLIVLIGIILDAKNARMKPCYGRFFRGCYDVCFQTKNDTPLQGNGFINNQIRIKIA
jgi:hypothetical protein